LVERKFSSLSSRENKENEKKKKVQARQTIPRQFL